MNQDDTIVHRAFRLIEQHPLATVLVLSGLARLVAVIWSQGFIHSDDHYDTIAVAYDWLQNGLWGPDGYLHWKGDPPAEIGRFPLYVLVQYGIMSIYQAFGSDSLYTIMYGIRLFHAALSLIPIWATYRIVEIVTGNRRWALIGGLVAGLHFIMPFLGVRNLIEIVGGDLWLVVLLGFYKYRADKRLRWLYLAGIFTGLAWMIRFQLAFAVLPIPLLLIWETRRVMPALHYCLAVGAMLLLAFIADWWLLGRFAASTLHYLSLDAPIVALYDTIPLLYVVILALVFLPPLSLAAFYLIGRPSFISRHRILFFSFLSFLLIHSVVANQQERFIFPMFSAFLLMGTLAAYEKYRRDGYLIFNRKATRIVLGIATVLNLLLIPWFSVAYGHKGWIEPLVAMSNKPAGTRVMIVQPEIKRWSAREYGGTDLYRLDIRDWPSLRTRALEIHERYRFDYFVLYPQEERELSGYVDSVEQVFGQLQLSWHVEPSWFDLMLYRLNPSHNRSYEAWVYSPAERTDRHEDGADAVGDMRLLSWDSRSDVDNEEKY